MSTTLSQYDTVAVQYEEHIVPRYARVAEVVAAAIDVRAGDAVLDIGAGTGGVARLLLPRLAGVGRLTLVDLSEPMLDVARSILTNVSGGTVVEFVAADLQQLPFGAGEFDAVVSQFSPLQETDRGVAEAHRVLRRGGRLSAAFWGSSYLELDLLNRVRRRVGIELAVPTAPAVIAERLRLAGFRDVDIDDLGFDADYPSADAYLAYRASFGRAVSVDDATFDRYWTALEDEVRGLARADGSIHLDWSVALVTATA